MAHVENRDLLTFEIVERRGHQRRERAFFLLRALGLLRT